MALNVGDVVRLKSGGPAMTIRWAGNDDGVRVCEVSWFNGEESALNSFPEYMLETAEPDIQVSAAAMVNFRKVARDAGWLRCLFTEHIEGMPPQPDRCGATPAA